MKIDWDQGNLKEIRYQDIGTLSSGWGVETADFGGFFSLENDSYGWECDGKDYSNSAIFATFVLNGVSMPYGNWNLASETSFSGLKFQRYQELVCTSDSYFQDFVMRFKFPKKNFPIAKINGDEYLHKGSNIWNQHTVTGVSLEGKDIKVKIEYDDQPILKGFRADVYVRDEPGDYWIVHFRLMPEPPNSLWIKWDTRIGRILSIKGRLARLILSSRWIRKILWYRAERIGGKPNIQALGLAKIKKGEKVSIKIKGQFEVS